MEKEKQIKLENLLAEFKKDYIDTAKNIDQINTHKFRNEKRIELAQFTYLDIESFDLKKYLAHLNWNKEKDNKEMGGIMKLIDEIEYSILNVPYQYRKNSNMNSAQLKIIEVSNKNGFKMKDDNDFELPKNYIYRSQLHL